MKTKFQKPTFSLLRISLILLLATCSAVLYAQPGPPSGLPGGPGGSGGPGGGPPSERLESMRIAFITEKLDLSTQEAQAFWPVYNEYRDALQALMPEPGEERPDILALSDDEIKAVVNTEMDRQQEELDIRREYFEKFQKVLPIRKVAMFYNVDREFKMELIRRMRERGSSGRPGERVGPAHEKGAED